MPRRPLPPEARRVRGGLTLAEATAVAYYDGKSWPVPSSQHSERVVRLREMPRTWRLDDTTAVPIEEVMLTSRCWAFRDRDEVHELIVHSDDAGHAEVTMAIHAVNALAATLALVRED